MADLSISEARDSLAEIVNRVAYQGERVLLSRHGKTVAALVPAADLERLAALESHCRVPANPVSVEHGSPPPLEDETTYSSTDAGWVDGKGGKEEQDAARSASTRQLPRLLHRAREVVSAYLRPVLAAHDLTDSQWRVLRILSTSDECDASSLARRSFLMQPSLSRILRDLSARGLIARRTSQEDARRSFQKLTAKGRRLLNDVAPAFNPAFREIERRSGSRRIRQLNAELAKLLEALQTDSAKTDGSGAEED